MSIKGIHRNAPATSPTLGFLSLLLGLALLISLAGPAGAAGDGKTTDPVIEGYKETAKTVTHTVATGLGSILAKVKNERKRIELIRSFIAPVRFYPDNTGYFYVYDAKGVNIAHGTQKELQGKNLYDYKDTKGKFVVRALSEAAKKGGGFVDFYWLKPGTKDEAAKIGYVEPIPGTNYFIGTGVYLP
ncbi:MAG TPA: cache domain-containing protein [Syntrophorhabdaceae bacterium]|jgi:signal transduction histidine kinase